jgi:signal peptidase II
LLLINQVAIFAKTGKIMKQFFKYSAIILIAFACDFFSKQYFLDLLSSKYGDVIFNPNAICAKCHINGVIASWTDIIGGDYGLSNLFNIHFIWNRGVSFSAFNFIMPVVLSVFTALIILWLLYYLFKRALPYERLPIALIIGGALGNLVDRVRFGAVVDFIQWHIGGLWTFPAIFNIGDMFITFGVILYLINIFINRRKCIRNLKD